MSSSLRDRLRKLPRDQRLERLQQLPARLAEEALNGAWWFIARPEQLPPQDEEWLIWLITAGRGWGKTRTGAEWLFEQVQAQPEVDGVPTEWAIIAQTFGEARKVMLDGPSGFLRVLARHGLVEGQDWEINRGEWVITFATGQKIHVLGAKDKDVGRGLNLAGAWLDEFAKWRWSTTIWVEGLAPALRIGDRPRVCVTTTPKPTCKQLGVWLARTDGSVHLTTGSTYDNRGNLSAVALDELAARYEGTRIGRQELYGELITDVEGALFTPEIIEAHRLLEDVFDAHRETNGLDRALHDTLVEHLTELGVPVSTKRRRWRRCIGVDPPAETAECGIVVGAAPVNARYGHDHAVVLADETVIGRPEEWGQRIVAAYRHWNCERVFVEKNQGGDMVRSTIHAVDSSVVVEKVSANDSKGGRAVPVAALSEKGLVHHVGIFPKLEDQLTTWVPVSPDDDGGRPQRSPDRLDAYVHLIRGLIPDDKPSGRSRLPSRSITQSRI